jgi:hypothetical protein
LRQKERQKTPGGQQLPLRLRRTRRRGGWIHATVSLALVGAHEHCDVLVDQVR